MTTSSSSMKEEQNNVASTDTSSNTSTQNRRCHFQDRQLLLLFSALSTCFFVGAALGWGPMQLMLEENGSFSSQCDDIEKINANNSADDDTSTCAGRTALLVQNGLLIPVAQILSPILGLFVDKFGPKKTAVAQATCLLVGLAVILLAVSTNTSRTDPLLFVGFGLVALHTWFGRLLIVQLGLYFTGHDISRVIFILNSLFDAGAVTYLGLWGIKQATGASTLAMLNGYAVLVVSLSAGYLYYWHITKPKNHDLAVNALEEELDLSKHLGYELDLFKHISESFPGADGCEDLEVATAADIDDQESAVETKDYKVIEETTTNEDKKADNDESCGGYVVIAKRTRKEQLTSTPFLLLCAFFGLNCMSNNWNIMTQRAFLAGLGDDNHGHLYLTLFVLMTPVSILGAPIIDRIILRFGWMVGFQTINLLGLAYTLIKVASTNLNVQILGFVLFSFYRSFLFGLTFSFLPTLVAGKLVGTAAGTISGVAGCVTLLTIPLVNVAVKGNDGDFFIPNMIMLCMVVPAMLLVSLLKKQMIMEHQAKEGSHVHNT